MATLNNQRVKRSLTWHLILMRRLGRFPIVEEYLFVVTVPASGLWALMKPNRKRLPFDLSTQMVGLVSPICQSGLFTSKNIPFAASFMQVS